LATLEQSLHGIHLVATVEKTFPAEKIIFA
jgi:hypothetical protein